MKNKEAILSHLFHESMTNIILGMKGVGKTNFTAVLMRDLVSMGYDIWTNVHFFRYEDVAKACKRGKLPKGVNYQHVPTQIHTISQLSELLYGLLKPGPKVVFLDEAGIVSPSGTSKDTKTIKQLAYIIRHFDCAFVLITQVAGSVPPDLRENLVDYRLTITKKGKTRFLEIGKRKVGVDQEGTEYIDFPTVQNIVGIPKSKLPYDGDFPSLFKIDIDLKKTLDAFGKLRDSLELEAKGEEILNKLMDSVKPELSKKELISNYKKEHPTESPAQIAKLFKTSSNYVSQC